MNELVRQDINSAFNASLHRGFIELLDSVPGPQDARRLEYSEGFDALFQLNWFANMGNLPPAIADLGKRYILGERGTTEIGEGKPIISDLYHFPDAWVNNQMEDCLVKMQGKRILRF